MCAESPKVRHGARFFGVFEMAHNPIISMQKESPVIFSQVMLISSSLTKISNTLYDQWVTKMSESIALAMSGDNRAAVAIEM